jgi:hypothetical protein
MIPSLALPASTLFERERERERVNAALPHTV